MRSNDTSGADPLSSVSFLPRPLPYTLCFFAASSFGCIFTLLWSSSPAGSCRTVTHGVNGLDAAVVRELTALAGEVTELKAQEPTEDEEGREEGTEAVRRVAENPFTTAQVPEMRAWLEGVLSTRRKEMVEFEAQVNYARVLLTKATKAKNKRGRAKCACCERDMNDEEFERFRAKMTSVIEAENDTTLQNDVDHLETKLSQLDSLGGKMEAISKVRNEAWWVGKIGGGHAKVTVPSFESSFSRRRRSPKEDEEKRRIRSRSCGCSSFGCGCRSRSRTSRHHPSRSCRSSNNAKEGHE